MTVFRRFQDRSVRVETEDSVQQNRRVAEALPPDATHTPLHDPPVGMPVVSAHEISVSPPAETIFRFARNDAVILRPQVVPEELRAGR